MKKFLAIILVMLTAACPALAQDDDWYLDIMLELSAEMGELAQDDVYFELMSSVTFDCVAPVKTADFSTLISAYRLNMPDEAGVRVLLKLFSGGELSDAALKKQVVGLPALPLTLYTGRLGSEQVAAMSLLTCTRTCVAPEDFVPAAYILEFNGAFVGAALSQTGEDTLTVQVQPLFTEEGAVMEDVLNAVLSDNLPMEAEKIL